MQIKSKIVNCHTADSKPVKQEVNGTMILPPLVFPGPSIAHLNVIHDLGLEESLGSIVHDFVAELGLGNVLAELVEMPQHFLSLSLDK